MADHVSNPWWRRLRALFAPAPARSPELDLPSDFLQLLERMRLLSIRAVGGGIHQGHRLGAYRGGQLEFHDYRAYTPGDDLRYLDWNLFARMERAFIKEFAREESGSVHLLLDATPSMALGHPPKWTFARKVAALFAHVAWSGQDQVHLSLFRPGVPPATFPPKGVKGNTPQLLEWLRRQPVAPPAQISAQVQPSSLAEGVHSFLANTPTKGRLFLLSDFWEEERVLTDTFQRLAGAGFDLSAIHVLAPEELQPPDTGDWRLFADEEPGDLELSLTPAVLNRYAIELESHRTAIEGAIRRRGGLYLQVSSDTSLERVLIQVLRNRRWLG